MTVRHERRRTGGGNGAGVKLDESSAGSGLGLAIARDLAGLYGGDLHLEQSEEGVLKRDCDCLRPNRTGRPFDTRFRRLHITFF